MLTIENDDDVQKGCSHVIWCSFDRRRRRRRRHHMMIMTEDVSRSKRWWRPGGWAGRRWGAPARGPAWSIWTWAATEQKKLGSRHDFLFVNSLPMWCTIAAILYPCWIKTKAQSKVQKIGYRDWTPKRVLRLCTSCRFFCFLLYHKIHDFFYIKSILNVL